MPGEEVEFIIEGCERLAGDKVRFGRLTEVIEVPLFTLGCRFDENVLSTPQRIERAGNDLARLIWEVRTDLAKLTDMEILQGAASHRGADSQARMVIKYQFPRRVDRSGADALNYLRELIIRELNALEHVLRILPGVGDDPRGHVWLEEADVEKEDADEG